MSLKVPKQVKAVFDFFPLVKYDINDSNQGITSEKEEKTIPSYIIYSSSLHKVDHTEISNDPIALRYQCLLHLNGQSDITKLVNVSHHAAPNCELPFLVILNDPNPNPTNPNYKPRSSDKRKLYNSDIILDKLLSSFNITLNFDEKIYLNMIDVAIGDYWITSLLSSNETVTKLRQETLYPIFREMKDESLERTNNLQNKLVDGSVLRYLSELKGFQVRHPRLATHLGDNGIGFGMSDYQKLKIYNKITRFDETKEIEEINNRAVDCLKALEVVIKDNKLSGYKWFAQGDSPGIVDIAIFGYIYLINRFLMTESIGGIILRHKELIEHSNEVFRFIFY